MTIQVKRTNVPGRAPSTLADGQIAINTADGLLFWKDSADVIQSFNLKTGGGGGGGASLGGYELISSGIKANATDEKIPLAGGYKSFRLVVRHLRPLTGSQNMFMRVSLDGTTYYSNANAYAWATSYAVSGATTTHAGWSSAQSGFTTAISVSSGSVTNTASLPSFFAFDIEPGTAARQGGVLWKGGIIEANAVLVDGIGHLGAVGRWAAVQFYANSGNLNIEWELYGLPAVAPGIVQANGWSLLPGGNVDLTADQAFVDIPIPSGVRKLRVDGMANLPSGSNAVQVVARVGVNGGVVDVAANYYRSYGGNNGAAFAGGDDATAAYWEVGGFTGVDSFSTPLEFSVLTGDRGAGAAGLPRFSSEISQWGGSVYQNYRFGGWYNIPGKVTVLRLTTSTGVNLAAGTRFAVEAL